MKRHEMWRQQYRNKRYMQYLSDPELRQRAKEVALMTKLGLTPAPATPAPAMPTNEEENDEPVAHNQREK